MATSSPPRVASGNWLPGSGTLGPVSVHPAGRQIRDEVRHRAVADVDQPAEHLGSWIAEEIGQQKHEFLRQHPQGKRLRLVPVAREGLIIFDGEELPDLSGQTGLQRSQKFQLHKVNPARLVEPMGDFHATALRVEFPMITRRKDEVIVHRLQLHPAAGGLSAIITLSRARPRRPAAQKILKPGQPVKVVAGGGEIILFEEASGRHDLGCADRGPACARDSNASTIPRACRLCSLVGMSFRPSRSRRNLPAIAGSLLVRTLADL